MGRIRNVASFVVPLGGALLGTPAAAQLQGTVIETNTRGDNTSVTQRARPEYDSPGIYAGAFLIQPEVTAEIGYTSNALLEESNGQSDGYAAIQPSIRFNSTWSRNALSGQVTGDFRRYFDSTIRDGNGYGADLNGRYEIGVSTSITGTARAHRRFESQYSLTSVTTGAALVPLNDYGGTLVATTSRGRVRLSALGNVSRLTYGDVTVNGARFDQSARNRTGLAGAVQADLSISDTSFAFLQIGGERFRYETDLPGGVTNRDSGALRILGGMSFDVSRLIRGRVGVGYIDRNYRSPSFRDVSGVTIEGQLEYFVTELTTITLNGHRVIEDAAIPQVGGFFRTGGQLRADHELLRNVLLYGSIEYDQARYADDGTVKLWQFSGGANYLMNRHMSLALDLTYGDRDQSGIVPGNGFDEFRSALSLSYRL